MCTSKNIQLCTIIQPKITKDNTQILKTHTSVPLKPSTFPNHSSLTSFPTPETCNFLLVNFQDQESKRMDLMNTNTFLEELLVDVVTETEKNNKVSL